MFNSLALYHAMLDADCSAGDLAKACNISRSAFYRRMSGEVQFTLSDIDACVIRLGLRPIERDKIFFAPKVN